MPGRSASGGNGSRRSVGPRPHPDSYPKSADKSGLTPEPQWMLSKDGPQPQGEAHAGPMVTRPPSQLRFPGPPLLVDPTRDHRIACADPKQILRPVSGGGNHASQGGDDLSARGDRRRRSRLWRKSDGRYRRIFTTSLCLAGRCAQRSGSGRRDRTTRAFSIRIGSRKML